MDDVIQPTEGHMHCYCPTCGNVAMALSDGPDDLPWCIHHEGRHVWKSGGVESGWTPMCPAIVMRARGLT